MILRRTALAGLCLCLCLFSGCSTSSGCSGGMSAGIPTSPFGGQWNGSWSNTTTNTSGTQSLLVDSEGRVTGERTTNTTGARATTTGTVTNGSTMSLTQPYPSETLSDSGTVLIATNGHLTGTLAESRGATALGNAIIDLTRQ